jgi:hypothetical protein
VLLDPNCRIFLFSIHGLQQSVARQIHFTGLKTKNSIAHNRWSHLFHRSSREAKFEFAYEFICIKIMPPLIAYSRCMSTAQHGLISKGRVAGAGGKSALRALPFPGGSAAGKHRIGPCLAHLPGILRRLPLDRGGCLCTGRPGNFIRAAKKYAHQWIFHDGNAFNKEINRIRLTPSLVKSQ